MSVELFFTNLTKLQAVFNLDDFILNFNATQINVHGRILKINIRADQNRAVQGGFFSCEYSELSI